MTKFELGRHGLSLLLMVWVFHCVIFCFLWLLLKKCVHILGKISVDDTTSVVVGENISIVDDEPVDVVVGKSISTNLQ